MTTPTRPRRWREVQRRPVPGNSPVRRFLRQAESIGPMESQNKNQNHLDLGVECRLPLVGPRAPVKERDGRGALCSSSAMSSDRLFLDRVARQHCPSPLHRHAQTTMHPRPARSKPDISTLQGIGHFYFALTHFHLRSGVSKSTAWNLNKVYRRATVCSRTSAWWRTSMPLIRNRTSSAMLVA